MRYLTLGEVVALQRRLIAASGGASRIRDLGALESAVAQPRASFGGDDLYPGLIEKAVALGFSLVMGHPFVDGNKRTGHAITFTDIVGSTAVTARSESVGLIQRDRDRVFPMALRETRHP